MERLKIIKQRKQSMKNIKVLKKIGQSLWYDNIQRSMIQNGEIARMIERGEIRGMTSNPSIFHNAIANSTDYDIQLQTQSWAGVNAEEIFWNLAIDDVQRAADIFMVVYKDTNKLDGYVSIEVNPNLANDSQATIDAALNLWKKVNRPNVMIKVPATKAGIPAIRKLISSGINVNVTLIFSVDRYKEVADAFISGLEDRIAEGKKIEEIQSVASFFVSRVDSKIDPTIEQFAKSSEFKGKRIDELVGKAAVYNSRLAYKEYVEIFNQPRFIALRKKGANDQRPLWASTSTKNPKYRDVMYVEDLIGKNTVNTIPPATLAAFLDHGKVTETIKVDSEKITPFFDQLANAGIHINEVLDSLEKEGVQAFSDAYNSLISTIETRRLAELTRLGDLFPKVKEGVENLKKEDFLDRLWDHDPDLWTNSPEGKKEITQRMDWLDAPWQLREVTSQTQDLLRELINDGFTKAVVLGMGGSSLAPEVFSKIQAAQQIEGESLALSILDSTHPDQVRNIAESNPVENTIIIVSSKSGTTGEINAFFYYFYDLAKKHFGEKAGSHFIAITDPGTKLEKLAKEKHFRKVITANPRVGGRNSALTAFGLVPAMLSGVDLEDMMKYAIFNGVWFQRNRLIEENPGIVLGVILGEAAKSGKNKLTILADDEWNNLAAWMEQLIAESSGKDGKGILPIAGEPIISPEKYGKDRIFVYLRKTGSLDKIISSLVENGNPVVQLNVHSIIDLGYQYFLWEVATATACSIMRVNSFDQPDVQDAKTRTLAGIEAYRKTGQFIIAPPMITNEKFAIYASQDLILPENLTILEIINHFLSKTLLERGYIAINAFIPRNEKNIESLTSIRKSILDKFETATTLGFGPRYLHSTGQLHKGGPENGVFVFFTNTPKQDMQIPGEGITFGKFCMAQALGDEEALSAHGRKILRVHFLSSEIDFS
jgi:transaldolase / glucose-6-phosphate isomerase